MNDFTEQNRAYISSLSIGEGFPNSAIKRLGLTHGMTFKNPGWRKELEAAPFLLSEASNRKIQRFWNDTKWQGKNRRK